MKEHLKGITLTPAELKLIQRLRGLDTGLYKLLLYTQRGEVAWVAIENKLKIEKVGNYDTD